MRPRCSRRPHLLVPLLLLLGLPGVAGAQVVPCDPIDGLDDRCEAWVSSFEAFSPTDAQDFWSGARVVAAPDGSRAFVTGRVLDGGPSGSDIAVAAYDGATGQEAWRIRYDGPAGERDAPAAIALSPGAETLYVAGVQDAHRVGNISVADMVVLAIETATGDIRWVGTYDGPAGRWDAAAHLAVAPGIVAVAGPSTAADGKTEFATVAFDPATGEQAWAARRAPTQAWAHLRGLTVDGDGTRLFVTSVEGRQQIATPGTLGGTSYEYLHGHVATVAYGHDEEGGGEQLWVSTYETPGALDDQPFAIEAAPDGGAVFVAGTTQLDGDEWDGLALSLDAADGNLRWARTYDIHPGEDDTEVTRALAVAPDGGRIYLGGGAGDFAVVAADAADGTELWTSTYGTPVHGDLLQDLAVAADGARVYATGWSFRLLTYGAGWSSRCDSQGNCTTKSFSHNESQGDYATAAFETTGGTQVWAARYNGSDAGAHFDVASSVAVGGDRVFVSGLFSRLMGYGHGLDLADHGTVAYPA